MKKLATRLPTAALLLLLLLLAPKPSPAQSPALGDAADTEAALRKLQVTGSVLYVGAHPDDENTALLAYLARGRGARTAYLSLTRGDGGQNLLGTEKGELLGVVRTQELLAARRVDGAEQFFTRAVDFGFTKSPEETFRFWGHDEVLADVVWVIRRFRPDVIITRFPTTGEGGHGQHTASAILAGEAFDAAGDPSRFPEQLKYVEPWKPKRLLWNAFNFRPGERPKDADKMPSADVGAYDPLLGKSYTEIAAESRTMHKSQGQGTPERRGPAPNYFALIKGEPASKDIFEGVDMTWRRVAGGEQVGLLLEEAARKYDASNPPAVLPVLVRAYALLSNMETSKTPADPIVFEKRRELGEVIRACAGLWIEAVASDPYVTPGGEVKVTTTLVNRSDFPLKLESVGVSSAGADVRREELKNNQPLTRETVRRVPQGADYSQPYWLREEPRGALFSVSERSLVGAPENAPPLDVPVSIVAGESNDVLSFDAPVLYRWTDRVRGDLYRTVAVVPEVTVNLEERTLVFPDRAAKRVRVTLKNNAGTDASGAVRLKLPAGWSASPAEVPVTLKGRGEEFRADFEVTPPQGGGVATLAAEFDSGGKTFTRGMTEINYPHIPAQTLFPVAEARLVRVDLRRGGGGGRVAYVMGSGDEVPEALRQVGYDVTLLSDEDLAGADFSKFDALITGVRAYNTRAALRQNQRRLLEYVERGGTLVVQYNTPDRTLEGAQLGPYPFKLTQDRVTDETAAINVLAPTDALMNSPNRITAEDFAGWVQERGLYFASDWDARYTPLFASHDPGEQDSKGSTLVARYGKGVYVFTSLAFFRQLPAGVPGAYRLFVNMISAGKN
ncbi:MAG TPA: PIG-L family deacetylase [Pyrinomonadaceae bacterium]|jgi:LmbE family N-acetylglucosaminyl deacetylase|nr:PIG-L family deacetylase [Pyrinomonadaceae bacterium]